MIHSFVGLFLRIDIFDGDLLSFYFALSLKACDSKVILFKIIPIFFAQSQMIQITFFDLTLYFFSFKLTIGF